MIVRALLGLVLGCTVLPSSLFAWTRAGHEIIAILAESRLTPEVREAVEVLLDGMAFVEAATWADRTVTVRTTAWHFVNIPLTERVYDPARVCPREQCLIGQIERFRRVLADPSARFRKRQKALMYLIHFAGDLHQPLHVVDNHDRGGNDVKIQFFGKWVDSFTNKPWNLHAVWDGGLLERNEKDPYRYAEELESWLQSQPDGIFDTGSIVDWAMESHDLALDHVYVLPEDRNLGADYFQANISIVDRQLAKAGVRLAKLLNEALGSQ